MATPGDLRRRFLALRVWSANRRRAPHKPLLALWAIGRCLQGKPRMAPFELVDRELAALLRDFGPPRKAFHTEAPFWRLAADRVWVLDRPRLARLTASGDAWRASLRAANMHGGLPAADYEAFRANRRLAREVAEALVDAHFPPTYRRAMEAVRHASTASRHFGGRTSADRTSAEMVLALVSANLALCRAVGAEDGMASSVPKRLAAASTAKTPCSESAFRAMRRRSLSAMASTARILAL